MTRDEAIAKARAEIAADKAAISGMDEMEKRALIAACIVVAVLVSIAIAVVRWVF